MKPLKEILRDLRKKGNASEGKTIILPQNFQKPEQMQKSSFQHYMKMSLNVICL